MKRILSGIVALLLSLSLAPAIAISGAEEELTEEEARKRVIETIELYEISSNYEIFPEEGAGNWLALVDYLTGVFMEHPELYDDLYYIWKDTVDRYSNIYNSAFLEQNYGTERVNQPGILFYNESDVLTVYGAEDNSPAAAAGLVKDSVVLEFNGIKPVGNRADDLNAIGNSYYDNDTFLHLKVMLPDGTEAEYDIDGADYDSDTASAVCEVGRVNPDKPDEIIDKETGYIRVTNGFNEDTGEKFAKAWKSAEEAGVTSVIIDLRDNGGGYVSTLNKILDTIIPARVPTYSDLYKESIMLFYSSGEGTFNPDIVILTNENSASASEVVTEVLKQNGLARSVGGKTFGKGIGQINQTLASENILAVTAFVNLLPNGYSYNINGVTPDAEVTDDPETELDEVLDFAYSYVDGEGTKIESPAHFTYSFFLPDDNYRMPIAGLTDAKKTADKLGIPIYLQFISSDGTKTIVDVVKAFNAANADYYFGIDKAESDKLAAELKAGGLHEKARVLVTATDKTDRTYYDPTDDFGYSQTLSLKLYAAESLYFYYYDDGNYTAFSPPFVYADGNLRFNIEKGGIIIISPEEIK
ncbi:MAG: hypothetical protein LBM59_07070 [Ruminococcus sp.]|jgi:carboxyl-terminal processing protease|nr:hypothetical protein [Ruminococcus sp.]